MRKDNESLTNYLLRLHNDSLDFKYEFSGTRPSPLINKYKNFIKALNFHEEMTDAEEKVFCEFLKADSTLKKTITKGRGKGAAEETLQRLYRQAIEYYDTNLKPNIDELYELMSSKDVQIHMMDSFRINSVTPDLEPSGFLNRLDELWNDFYECYFRMIATIKIGKHTLRQAVSDEISLYKAMDKGYNQPTSEYVDGDFYYTGINDNPYKNLYLYCLFQYVEYFLDAKLPSISRKQFEGLEALKPFIEKESFSLREIAKAYALVSKESLDQTYDNFKSLYRKYNWFKSCKNKRGHYQFHDISEPLAFYVFYRKKNVPPSEHDNLLIHYVYKELIELAINGKLDEIAALDEYHRFFKSEYLYLLKTVFISDDKFRTFLEILMNTAGRISLRLISPKEEVDMILR